MPGSSAATAFACAADLPPLTAAEMRQLAFAGGDFVTELDPVALHDAFGSFEAQRWASPDLRNVLVEMPVTDGTGHYHAATFHLGGQTVTLLTLRTMIRLTASYAILDHHFQEERAQKVLEILRGYRMDHHFVAAIPEGFAAGWTGTRVRFDPDTGTLTAQIHPLPRASFVKVGPARAELSAGGQGAVSFRVRETGGAETPLARYLLPGAANLRDIKAFADILNATPHVGVSGALVRSGQKLEILVDVEDLSLSQRP